ncbi:hypothetical protein [Amaricoccus solimangrovi]|uniref:DUF1127 domain-containing protein n=1 Tax=Amaricoccus solimangrovi TaxID=2589815 RepID=A0A501WRG7_9RHOB|nr:hypothetical protein [Amaricoccus solimangrovi]TPE52059.1 hypothetical protein FJM51_06425 [Amaricoccus solimangrovi]
MSVFIEMHERPEARHGYDLRGFLAELARRARAAMARRQAIARTRQQYRMLLTCEDSVLRDIGVSRLEVRAALREL